MTLRGETGVITTRYVVNGRALRRIRETEQFMFSTGPEPQSIECRTSVTISCGVAVKVTLATAGRSRELFPVDRDWARFQQLVGDWHKERGATSSPVAMAMCPAYQKIIAMGKPAIRFILKQLELEGDDPDHWFWALESLTGANPVRPENRGHIKKMRADWILWGTRNGETW